LGNDSCGILVALAKLSGSWSGGSFARVRAELSIATGLVIGLVMLMGMTCVPLVSVGDLDVVGFGVNVPCISVVVGQTLLLHRV